MMAQAVTKHETGTREEWLALWRELFKPCGFRLPGWETERSGNALECF
jgi:hypothetical protein